MLWDGLTIALIITLGVAGWNVGFINSWRGPVAILIATIATHQFYVDFCTWIVQQLRVQPIQAIGIGYLLLWLAIDIVLELLMSVFIPLGTKNRPVFFGRVAGAAFGVFRGLVIILLPMIALQGPVKIPAPPADKAPLINPMQTGIDKSGAIGMFNNIAKGLYPIAAPLVVSNKEPSFKPNFAGSTAVDEMNKDQK
jgi:uncharacterized membrane protein required for colicin V production